MEKDVKRGYQPAKRRGHGPGPKTHEKAKDFVGTWKKLISYIQKYILIICIALVCSIGGTILTLVGPDKLSDLTNTVTAGIAPNTEKLQEITEEMSSNISNNIEKITTAILSPLNDQQKMAIKMTQIMQSSEISNEDKLSFQSVLTNLSQENMHELFDLPNSILEILFEEIKIDENIISTADQIEFMKQMNNLDLESTDNMLSIFEEMPESIRNVLYSDIEIDHVVITKEDQQEMIQLFSSIDMDNVEATSEVLEAIDELPSSVYQLIEPHIDMDQIFSIGLMLVSLYGLSLILSIVQNWTMATVTQKISKNMRSDISKKINRLPIWYYNKTTTGDVLSRVTNDVDTIGQTLNQSIANLITAIITLFGSLFMMIKTNGTMTITAVFATLIGFVFMFMIMGRSQKYFMLQQSELGNINGYIEEMYTGQIVVKAYNGEEKAKKQFFEMNNKLRDASFKAQCMSGLMQPLMGFIGNFGYVAVCVVGGALAMNGEIEFGVIVAFMMYVRYFTNPLSQIAQSMQSLQSAAAAGERVFEFLEAEEMEDETYKTQKLENIQGSVDFEHVKFGYEDSNRTVIHDFCASAKPGQKIAIVGPTGAGKTTMVNLLMRFHEIQEGTIKIDGISTKDLKRVNVREQFCMVLQDTWLFEGTIKENLIYSTQNVSEEKMIEACKAVGLDHFIRTLPHGYDTVLNDQVNLSQGQKQQLTIARAMIADRPMLILDEATSSVDTRTELKIQEAMDKLMENRTSFVIAHRLSTIKNADIILVVKDGDIIESGNHEQLLEKNGFYAELYNSQFEECID